MPYTDDQKRLLVAMLADLVTTPDRLEAAEQTIAALVRENSALKAEIEALKQSITPPVPIDPKPTLPVMTGAYIKGNTYGLSDAPWNTTTIDRFETNAGKKLSILHWGQTWKWTGHFTTNGAGLKSEYQAFPRTDVEKVRLRGSIPFINWSACDLAIGLKADQAGFRLIEIINGKHDAYLRQWARDAKTWGYPLFVRMNHEMNGDWYHWSERRNGNKPGEYRAAWRRVVDIFKAEGATNVTWVWNPNGIFNGSQPLSEVYPGDDYTDWLAIDYYNWGTNPNKPNRWKSFSEVMKPTYDALATLGPASAAKPVMLAEWACSEHGGSKADWITDALTVQIPRNFPRIKAVVWFNWNTDGMDWVIETSSAATAAFKAGFVHPAYASNTFGNLPKLTKVQPVAAQA